MTITLPTNQAPANRRIAHSNCTDWSLKLRQVVAAINLSTILRATDAGTAEHPAEAYKSYPSIAI